MVRRKQSDFRDVSLEELLLAAPTERHRAAIKMDVEAVRLNAGDSGIEISFDGDFYCIASVRVEEDGIPASSASGGFSDDPTGEIAASSASHFLELSEQRRR